MITDSIMVKLTYKSICVSFLVEDDENISEIRCIIARLFSITHPFDVKWGNGKPESLGFIDGHYCLSIQCHNEILEDLLNEQNMAS